MDIAGFEKDLARQMAAMPAADAHNIEEWIANALKRRCIDAKSNNNHNNNNNCKAAMQMHLRLKMGQTRNRAK